MPSRDRSSSPAPQLDQPPAANSRRAPRPNAKAGVLREALAVEARSTSPVANAHVKETSAHATAALRKINAKNNNKASS